MFELDVSGFERLENALKDFQGNAEDVINDVLHNEGGPLLQEAIRRLMPVSGARWKGKKGAAKTSNSLMSITYNLAVEVATTKNYQYLYFPNDGTNTRRHAGNQQFFYKGGEDVQDEIIDRCVARLTENF